MPQLKITNYLTNDIIRNVAELYKPHIDKAEWQDPVMTEMFYDIIVPEEGGLREALSRLPQCFITHGDQFPFRGVYVHKLGHHRAYPHIAGHELQDFYIQFASARDLPCQKFLPHCDMGETGKVEAHDLQWQPFLKMLDNHLRNIKQAETQHKNAERGVEILLDRHKTIQPILRSWPALWDLLPHAAQETIAGKPSRYEGFQWPVYDNPVLYNPPANTFGDADLTNNVINSLEHLTMMLVTKKINQRA